MDMFPHGQIQHIVTSRSDHFPLLLTLDKVHMSNRKKNFRYEMMWERVNTLEPTVKKAWSKDGTASTLAGVAQKLREVQKSLMTWSRKDFGSVTWNIKKKRQKLKELTEKSRQGENEELIKQTGAELDELLPREEIMWRQRSRATWIKEGDQNTKFFHRKATWRQKKNAIKN